jgi:hypothetical protein
MTETRTTYRKSSESTTSPDSPLGPPEPWRSRPSLVRRRVADARRNLELVTVPSESFGDAQTQSNETFAENQVGAISQESIVVGRLNNFQALESWEGAVTEVLSSYFVARLASKLTGAEEEAQIPLSEVSSVDQVLVQVGSRFYWTIGYFESASGQRSRQSVLRFRRLTGDKYTRSALRDRWIAKVSASWLNPS